MRGKIVDIRTLRRAAYELMMGTNRRVVAVKVGLSRTWVNQLAQVLRKNYHDFEELHAASDSELAAAVYPGAILHQLGNGRQVLMPRRRNEQMLMPDFQACALKHLDLQIPVSEMYADYCREAGVLNKDAMSRSLFFKRVRQTIDSARRGDVRLRLPPSPFGEVMEIDYVGTKIELRLSGGESCDIRLCVLTWPASGLIYAQPVTRLGILETCAVILNGLRLFGVRPRLLRPDNTTAKLLAKAKSRDQPTGLAGVSAGNGTSAKVTFNQSFMTFMDELGIGVAPAKPRATTAKEYVDSSCGLCESAALSRIDPYAELTLEQHAERIQKLVERHINQRPYHEGGLTRRELFEVYEKNHCQDLPPVLPTCVEHIGPLRVPRTCNVKVAGMSYSVPRDFIGQMVDVRLYEQTVQIYMGDRTIATHTRCDNSDMITRPEHRPEHHAAVAEQRGKWLSDDEIREQLEAENSEALTRYCKQRLACGDAQRFIACSAVIRNFRRAVNRGAFEQAMEEAIKGGQLQVCTVRWLNQRAAEFSRRMSEAAIATSSPFVSDESASGKEQSEGLAFLSYAETPATGENS